MLLQAVNAKQARQGIGLAAIPRFGIVRGYPLFQPFPRDALIHLQ
jgi:hypothetical protein